MSKLEIVGRWLVFVALLFLALACVGGLIYSINAICLETPLFWFLAGPIDLVVVGLTLLGIAKRQDIYNWWKDKGQ